MIKRELGLRERRKIYEDTIYVVAQTQKIGSVSSVVLKERAVKNMVSNQTDRCVSILATVLGYHETVLTEADGTKKTFLLPEDNDMDYAIEKEKFENVVQRLPANKELKEALWKSFVKRDKKAIEKLEILVA